MWSMTAFLKTLTSMNHSPFRLPRTDALIAIILQKGPVFRHRTPCISTSHSFRPAFCRDDVSADHFGSLAYVWQPWLSVHELYWRFRWRRVSWQGNYSFRVPRRTFVYSRFRLFTRKRLCPHHPHGLSGSPVQYHWHDHVRNPGLLARTALSLPLTAHRGHRSTSWSTVLTWSYVFRYCLRPPSMHLHVRSTKHLTRQPVSTLLPIIFGW